MTTRCWNWLVAVSLLASVLFLLIPNNPLAGGEMTDVLIEWNKENGDLAQSECRVPDVTVFADGRLRFGPRLGGGEIAWSQLSQEELEELRRFAFEEQDIMSIERTTLSRDVQAAVEKHKLAMDSESIELSAEPQMDAATTVLRATDAGRMHEVRYYDLFGDAQSHPEIEGLQRLRKLELRLLQLAEEHASEER